MGLGLGLGLGLGVGVDLLGLAHHGHWQRAGGAVVVIPQERGGAREDRELP